MRIKLPYKFIYRDYQYEIFKAFFLEKIKRAVCIWHRRAGKDKTFLNILIYAAFQRVGNYVYLFPEQRQARRVIWQGIDKNGIKFIDHIPKELIKGNPNNTEMLIRLINGSTFQLLGSDNFDSLMGSNPVGVVFSEFSLQNPLAWEYIRPILAENDGWALFQGTPRGLNHLYDLYQMAKNKKDWFTQFLTIENTKDHYGNPIVTPELIEEYIEEGMPPELVQQEFYCSFSAGNVGSYYGSYISKAEDEGRIKDFDIDPLLPVYTFWDLGVSDSTAIWMMQFYKGEIRIINYYESNSVGLEHYFNYLVEFQNKYKIKYGDHFAPHDIKIRELTSGKSRFEYAISKGIRFNIVSNIPIDDGIQAVRSMFPKFIFHKTNCRQGLRCLLEYKKKYMEDKHCYSDKPLHNWASHGADAFRYLAVGWSDYYANPSPVNIRRLNEVNFT